MVIIQEKDKILILERLDGLENNNVQNLEICQDVQTARDEIQNGVLEELEKYHPEVQKVINGIGEEVEEITCKVDIYSTEEARKWAKNWGAEKIRNTAVRSNDLFVTKESGIQEDMSFFAYLSAFYVRKKISFSDAKEYLALMAEDKDTDKTLEQFQKERLIKKIDTYSMKEARKFAKNWGSEKIRNTPSQHDKSQEPFVKKGAGISMNASFFGYAKIFGKRNKISWINAREYLALMAEDKETPEILQKFQKETLVKKIDVYSIEEARKLAKNWEANKIRNTVTNSKDIFVTKRLGVTREIPFSLYINNFGETNLISQANAREYLALMAEDKDTSEILKQFQKEQKVDKVDIYSIEEARKLAKNWGADRIKNKTKENKEIFATKGPGISRDTSFSSYLSGFSRKNKVSWTNAREYLALMSEDKDTPEILNQFQKELLAEKIDTYSFEEARKLVKIWGSIKIRNTSTGSRSIFVKKGIGITRNVSFSGYVNLFGKRNKISVPNSKEYLALMSEDKDTPEILQKFQEENLAEKIDTYSMKEARKFARNWGAEKIRNTSSGNREVFVKKGIGITKNVSFSDYILTFSKKNNISWRNGREYLGLMAEDKDTPEILQKFQKESLVEKVDIYSVEEIRKLAKNWGVDKLRSPFASIRSEKFVNKGPGISQDVKFGNYIGVLSYKINISYIDVREYLALIAEDKDTPEILKQFQKDKQIIDDIDIYSEEESRKWAKKWGSSKIRNTPSHSKENFILREEGGRDLSFSAYLDSFYRMKKISYPNSREYLALMAEDKDTPEILQKFQQEYNDRSLEQESLQQEKNEQSKLEQNLEELLQEIKGKSLEHEGLDLQEIRQMIRVFGSANILDVLYLYHDKYKGIPVEKVKSMIADSLGDFLMIQSLKEFNTGDVYDLFNKDILPEELPSNLEKTLLSAFKGDCLRHYNQQKKAKDMRPDGEIILDYLIEKEEEFENVNHKSLRTIIQKVLEYYGSLLDRNMPSNIKRELSEGRLFPDINQLINIEEINTEGNMLIADDMGLGKSASAILAKESLGLGLTLILSPPNVTNTWKTYLSDKDDGYFEEGKAPRVFEVESLEELKNINPEDYDYILLSHARLNEGIGEVLKTLPIEYCIVDEVHELKNVKEGNRSKVLQDFCFSLHENNSESKLALLSGTPVPNKIQDVAILLKLLFPEEYGKINGKELVRQIINGDLLQLRRQLMQRMTAKKLRESVELPAVTETVIEMILGGLEKDIYKTIIDEEDELGPMQKIHLIRKLLLNPSSVDSTPGLEGARIERMNQEVKSVFQEKKKVVGFINGYVENILDDGGESLIKQLKIPDGVELHVIYGGTSQDERDEIQRKINNGGRKMLVLVSGATAGVGIDFTGANEVWEINQPWTKNESAQQLARVVRYGLNHEVNYKRFLIKDSLEMAIDEYREKKYEVVSKLLLGVLLTENDKLLLSKDEGLGNDTDAEVNPKLAKEYLSQAERMNQFFAYTKEIGEKELKIFLKSHGETYANFYKELGARSYQANNARVSGAILQKIIEKDQPEEEMEILDLASGPQMLFKHAPRELQKYIHSMDINESHFENVDSEKYTIGSFLDIPRKKESVNYVNFGLAWNYTKLILTDDNYERLEVLIEINRVLKKEGKVLITLPYSIDLKSEIQFEEVLGELGFKVVKDFTGKANFGGQYEAQSIALEKVQDSPPIKDVLEKVEGELIRSMKFKPQKRNLNNKKRNILHKFEINGQEYDIQLNEQDEVIYKQEQGALSMIKKLKKEYGDIKNIPKEYVLENGLVRYKADKNYRLFKMLGNNNGVVMVR